MGTEYEYAVNLLSSAANSRKSSSIVDKERGLQTAVTDIRRLQSSMDRMIDELHSFESIKKAMLEHDRIFQHQVKELHRVYGVQRTLMSELKYKVRIRADRRAESTNLANRHYPEAIMASGYSLNAPVLIPYPSFNETTGSASGENLAKPGCFDFEMPARGAGTAEGKHSQTTLSEEDVELTLSIGNAKNGNKRMKKTHHHHHLGQPHFEEQEKKGSAAAAEDPGRGEERSRTATSDQDRKRPHWLFQSLSSLHQT